MPWLGSRNTAYIGAEYKGTAGVMFPNGGVIWGGDGEAYFVGQGTDGASNDACKVIKLSDGSLAATMQAADIDAALGYTGLTNSVNGGAVGDDSHFWAMAWDRSPFRVGIAYWYIDSGGAPAVRSAHLIRGSGFSNIDDGDVFCCGLVDGGGFGEQFVVLTIDDNLRAITFPGPSKPSSQEIDSTQPWTSRSFEIGDAAILEDGVADEATYRAAKNAGALFFADGELYGLWTKGDVDYEVANPGQAAPLDLEVPAGVPNSPNGFIAKFDTQIVNESFFPRFQLNGYAVDNANWGDFPWTDSTVASDGSTTDTSDDYMRQPVVIPWITGNWFVAFVKVFDPDAGAGGDLDPTGTRFRVRAYIGDATHGWNEATDIEGSGYDVVSDAGVAEASRYSAVLYPVSCQAVWHPEHKKVVIVEQKSNSAPTPLTNDYVLSTFADLEFKNRKPVVNLL